MPFSDGARVTRVRENVRQREEKESYIQNSQDQAELSDLAVAMAGVSERWLRKSTGKRIRKVGVQVVTCKFEP